MWETDLAWNLVVSLVSIECEGNGCQGILRLHLILCIEKIVGKDAFTVNLIGIGMSCSVHGPCCFVISAWILSNGAIATECPLYNFLYNLQSQHLVQVTVYSWNISFHEIEDQHDWSFVHIVYTLWRYANSMTVFLHQYMFVVALYCLLICREVYSHDDTSCVLLFLFKQHEC